MLSMFDQCQRLKARQADLLREAEAARLAKRAAESQKRNRSRLTGR